MPPLAHYKLNGDATDASGNGKDGTPTDVSYVAGKIRQAGSFNGTSSKVNLGADFLGPGNVTVSAWINAVGWGGGGFGRIFDNGKYRLYIRQASTNLYLQSDAGATAYASSAVGSIGLGTWIHVAATRASGAGTANIYINGVLSGNADQNSGVPTAGSTNLFMGSDSGTTRIFNGLFDDVRIYNEILPAWKIRAIYHFGKGGEECEPWQRLIRPTIKPVIRRD